ncbi:hypothetical protein RJ640_024480 [Escallonia rubra]|uniref:Uncharacterized protein n=1 Tax=Escallonia rubra TaxID=112253 RepID=A0AA88S333_9ASTE|nr:hypothetical protein RJ640_024480 [Escallonia rubra]
MNVTESVTAYRNSCSTPPPHPAAAPPRKISVPRFPTTNSSHISGFIAKMHSFFKQFYGSTTKTDYVALRLGFITMHCRGDPKFNFHKYMICALEDDFKKVVGIRQVILKPPRDIFVYRQINASIFLLMVYLFLLSDNLIFCLNAK